MSGQILGAAGPPQRRISVCSGLEQRERRGLAGTHHQRKKEERGGAYRGVDGGFDGVEPLEGVGVELGLQEELTSRAGRDLEPKTSCQNQETGSAHLLTLSPGRRSSCWTCLSSSQSRRHTVAQRPPYFLLSDGTMLRGPKNRQRTEGASVSGCGPTHRYDITEACPLGPAHLLLVEQQLL